MSAAWKHDAASEQMYLRVKGRASYETSNETKP